MLLATVSVYIRDHHCIVQNEEVGVKETLSDYYYDKLLDSPFKLNFLEKQNHKL